MSSSILIIGAGYLGSQVAQRATTEGMTPVFVGRRHPRPDPIRGATAISLDVTRPETLQALPTVDAIVYAVAAEDHSAESYDAAYYQGLKHLLQAVSRWRDRPHIVYVSSTSVYTEESGAALDETSLDLATKGPSAALVAGEKLLEQSTVPYTILRFGGIYGPERLYFVNRVRSGVEYLYDGPPIYSNRIHRDDGARAILHTLEEKSCRNRTFNVVDDAPANRNEVVAWLHQRLGLTTPLATTKDRSLLAVRGNKRCLNKALRDTGFHLQYPNFREGYNSIITELGTPAG